MKFVPLKVSTTAARLALKTEKHAPSLLFVAGVTGAIGATVLACRSTLKLEETIDAAHDKLADVTVKFADDLESKDHRKAVTRVYIAQVGELGKLYAPSIIVGSLSIAALTKSHNMLVTRNAALTATVATLTRTFAEYRQRVEDEYGVEAERNIRYAATEVDVTTEGKNGPKVHKEMRVGNLEASPYAVFFGPDNQNWSPIPEYNIMFLRLQQNWLNDKLRARGHLLLNEAYDVLGFDQTYEGSVAGWVAGHNPKNELNDQYVDFGVFTDEARDQFFAFVTGSEGELMLDFNVDGPVNDLIGKVKR